MEWSDAFPLTQEGTTMPPSTSRKRRTTRVKAAKPVRRSEFRTNKQPVDYTKPKPGTKAAKPEPGPKPQARDKKFPAKAAKHPKPGKGKGKVTTALAKRQTKKNQAARVASVAKKQVEVRKGETLKVLKPVAKEINVRLDKAALMDSKADDHRLAASLRLAEARARCNEADINFKSWVGDNVIQSYNTVRKLATVGDADDPKAALSDLRAGVKVASQILRDKKKKAEVKSTVNGIGMVPTVTSGIDAIKLAFADLKPSDKMEFVEWAADEVGGEFTHDLNDIPKSLRKTA